jgi:hypothetical protein
MVSTDTLCSPSILYTDRSSGTSESVKGHFKEWIVRFQSVIPQAPTLAGCSKIAILSKAPFCKEISGKAQLEQINAEDTL